MAGLYKTLHKVQCFVQHSSILLHQEPFHLAVPVAHLEAALDDTELLKLGLGVLSGHLGTESFARVAFAISGSYSEFSNN